MSDINIMNQEKSYPSIPNLMVRVNELLLTLAKTPGPESKEYKMAEQILTWLKRAQRCDDEAMIMHFFESSILPKLSHLSIHLHTRQQHKAFAAKPKILSAVKHITAENDIAMDTSPALHKPLATPKYTPAQRQQINIILSDLKNLLGQSQ